MITPRNRLTKEQTADVLYEAIRLCIEYPDNVYDESTSVTKRCSYNTGSNSRAPEEGCLVGQAIRRIGLSAPNNSSWGITTLTEDGDSNHARALQLLQDSQDAHESWGRALERLETNEPMPII